MKERVKILAIALVGILSLSLHTTVKAETITGSYERGNYAKIDGLFQTHNMKLTIDGQSYDVYCAWYENTSPEQNGKYTFESVDIEQKYAVGVSSIMNDNVITNGMTSEDKRVVKTMALNLYLSMTGVTAGKNCGASANRFDGSVSWLPNSYTLIHEYYNNLPGMLEKLRTSNDPNWKKVYDLYISAKRISDNYETPYLRFTDSTNNAEFTLSGGYYSKTYQLESNVDLVSIKAIPQGVDSSKVIIKTSLQNKTITVRIPKKEYEDNPTTIKIVAEAETTLQETKLYIASGADRCRYQDLVITKVGVKNISVTTEDVIEMKRCYRYVINCDDTACNNTNSNNIRNCESKIEEYHSLDCDTDDRGNTASGKYTATLKAGVCSLYCTEKAKVSYPGNVRPAIVLGTNLQWPTASNGLYPLQTTAELTCQVEMDNGGAVTQECLELASRITYKNEANSAQVKYNDTKTEQTAKLKSACSQSTSISGNGIIIQNNCHYTLDNVENMINKETLEFVKETAVSLSDAVTNYILIEKYGGVLPVAGYNWIDNSVINDLIFDDFYDLKIENMPLGYDNQFNQALNTNAYVCNYKVTTDLSGSCACPPGTVHNGRDLFNDIVNSSTPKTCAEAIEIYCDDSTLVDTCTKSDGTKVDITSCMKTNTRDYCEIQNGCSSNEGICPTNSAHPDRSYASCVYGGKTESECIQEVCYDPYEYKCPADSKLSGMDISDCVQEKKAQGISDAYAICSKLCNGGGTIIYRTISLENPFPSKDADATVNQTGLTTGMFNDLIKGRYPGTNWNSITLVSNKILNNRGYDGSAIYQEATPLYTINLDAKAIKEIRTYNKKQTEQNKGGYADFELECTDGAYCISSFLHDNIITTATGEPILDYQNSTCANAHDKSSFISCYTYK